ncbi:MAG TPA: pantetheine-phosphate adenylyltransferase [Rectinemataceae bacterium]|nr:pantetheine-phosphate adenylyltransferase [Rectinemataceae bacterium]
MVKAVFAGSFDPPTFGHLNIMERAKGIFEHLYVVVAVNKHKSGFFSPEERLDLLKKLLSPWPNVSVHLHDRLVVEFAREHGCKVLVRGVRSIHDFSYEFELSIMNKGLGPDIETFFMPTDPRYFVLRSSAIKELASFKGDLSAMVPPEVAVALRLKMEAEEGGGGAGIAHA